MSRKSSLAFTLTEMLIVIGIIAILAGLLMPALGSAQRDAMMLSCISNLKNVSYSLDMYENDFYSQAPPWLSSTELYETPEVLVCPEDQTMGDEGSVPDWIKNASQFAETNDMAEEDFTTVDRMPGAMGSLAWYKNTFSEFMVNGKRRTEALRRPLRKEGEGQQKIKGSSYLYEFNGECVSWGQDGDTWGQGQEKGTSWHDAKIYQRDFCITDMNEPLMAARVPIARCFHHITPRSDGQLHDEYQPTQNVPAIRINRNVDKSWPRFWQYDRRISIAEENEELQ